MRNRAALLLPVLLAACTVGPALRRARDADARRLRPGDRRSGRANPPARTLGRIRQQRTRRADHARARGQHDDRAGRRAPRTRPAPLGLSVYYWFPTVTAVARPREGAVQHRGPVRAARRVSTDTYRAGFDASWEIDLFGSLRNEYRAIRTGGSRRDVPSLADAQLSIVAETAQAWFSLIGARERLALRRAAAREPAGQRPDPDARASTPAVRTGSTSRRPRRRCAASPLPCRSPRPTSCARNSGSRC